MGPSLLSFTDELVKTAISPLAKSIAKNSLIGMGFEAALNPTATPLSTIREGIGFGVGDEVATAVARGMGFGRIGQMAAGIVGGRAFAGALRNRFADKPRLSAVERLPDTEEFKPIKMAAATKSVLTPQSSNVSGYSYDPATQSLSVTYKSGGTYSYKGVPPKVVRSLGRNKSIGKTLAKKIKPSYEYEKIGKMTAFGEDHYDEADDAGWKDKIPGGKADDKFPADFDFDALDEGMKHELEHTTDRQVAMEIAMDHLAEDPDYYAKLEKLEKKASRISKFLRGAPIEKLRPAVEGIVGSSPPSFIGHTDLNKILKFIRGGGDEISPSISRLDREELVKKLRRRMKGSVPNARSVEVGPNVEFGRSLGERSRSPMVTVRHGGTEPELQSILKYGPNANVPQVPGVAGKKEIAGLFVHKPSDALAGRVSSYAKRRAGYSGGSPAVLEFDVPERLLSETGRIGGGEHVLPASLWRHAKNQKITKIGEALRERVREGAPSIIGKLARTRRSMQKAAGVAKKQVSYDGLPLKLEHEPGDIRSGTSKDGKTWSRKMHASYGYVPGTKGKAADGDAVDIYLAKEPVPGAPVFEVSQKKKEGPFDEHKYMLGYESAAAAKADYLKHMPSWAFDSMKSTSMDEFKGRYKS